MGNPSTLILFIQGANKGGSCDWTAPDANNDGIVDTPYLFTGGQDDLSWTQQNGWRRNYFWTWYDGTAMMDWVLMSNPADSAKVSFSLTIGGAPQALADSFGLGAGVVPGCKTLTPIYPGLIGGPVKVSSLTGAKAIISQRSLMGNSFEEVLGTDASKLSDHYYWTWYDMQSPGVQNWVLVANPSSTDTVHAVISFVNRDDGQPVSAEHDIAPGSNWTPTFPGKMGGPVEVKAYLAGQNTSWPADARKVIASQRVLSAYGTAFNEVPGIAAGDLTSDYLWTWYDMHSSGFQDWVLVANPNNTPESYEIKIGGVVQPNSPDNPGIIPAHGRVTPTFSGQMNGPVEVDATGEYHGNLIATQRVLAGPSFEEIPGYPASALNNDYHWTWYDMVSPGSSNWVLVANNSDSTVTDSVKIAGETMPNSPSNPGTISPHSRVTPLFPGKMAGPVEVSSSAPVIVSQRVMWNGYFNEVLGTLLN